MNEHAGVIYKDHITLRRPPEPPQKRQRRPLGLAPVLEEVSPPSALDGVPADVLASPATVEQVLQGIDAAVGLRTESDRPLKVRIARLESDNTELKAGLAAAQATIARMETMAKALKSALPRKDEFKIRFAAEAKDRVAIEVKNQLDAMNAKRLARRAEQKAVK